MEEVNESETLIDLEASVTSVSITKALPIQSENIEIIPLSETTPDRPVSTLSIGIDSKVEQAEPEIISGLNSPSVVTVPLEDDKNNDDEEDSSAGYEESAERDEIIRERINRTQDQMRLIVDNLSEDQLKRYERFRRVGLARPIIERLMQRILDQRVNSTSVIVLAGIAKVFVGELVEGARVVMEEELRAQLELNVIDPDELEESIMTEMHNRPLEPFHIIESHRRMQQESFSAPPSLIYSKPSPF